MVYQSDYCYSGQFATCSAFLAWAARNAAEPAYVSEAARKAWASGIAAPDDGDGAGAGAAVDRSDEADQPMLAPTLEDGLFGPADPDEAARRGSADALAWVSASAWAEAPWDPEAEAEAEELEAMADEEPLVEPSLADEEPVPDEALEAPKVPAALPMRRRRAPLRPIRARGSGYFADPPGREPLVSRRGSIGPPILLAVLGLLVVSIIVFMLPTLIGGGDGERTAAGAPASPGASARVAATRPPAQTARPSSSPSPTPEPEIRVYVVKPGDTLSGIATRASIATSVRLLQCINGLTNPNLLQPGQELLIPPDGYSCPPGWRRASPAP